MEGITNAVTHRNYAMLGEHIKVFIFDDRMEIRSPGKLPGLVTLENMKKVRYARNTKISETLQKHANIKNNWNNLSIFEQNIIRYINDRGEAGTTELTKFTGRARNTVLNTLKKLENLEIIVWIGTNNHDPKKSLL